MTPSKFPRLPAVNAPVGAKLIGVGTSRNREESLRKLIERRIETRAGEGAAPENACPASRVAAVYASHAAFTRRPPSIGQCLGRKVRV
jgi:hypothetical protein